VFENGEELAYTWFDRYDIVWCGAKTGRISAKLREVSMLDRELDKRLTPSPAGE
jgi:hypothetical protein